MALGKGNIIPAMLRSILLSLVTATTGLVCGMIFGLDYRSALLFAMTITIVVVLTDMLLQRLLSRNSRRRTSDWFTWATDRIGGRSGVEPAWTGVHAVHARELSAAIAGIVGEKSDLQGELRDLEVTHQVAQAGIRQVQMALDALQDAVIVTNTFDEITVMNDAACRILGLDGPASDHLQKPCGEVVANDSITTAINDTCRSGRVADTRRLEIEIDTGSQPGVFEACTSCFRSSHDSIGGVITVLRDITREREISQMKTDFVSKASHELRTPLSSIRAYVEMLVDGEADDPRSRSEFYKVMQGETERLSRLIDNMLNISRIEAGIDQIERVSVDMSVLVDRAMDTLAPQAQAKQISMSKRTEPVSVTVEGDEDLLYEVILNLLSNGIKYTPEGGRVTVSLDLDNLSRSVVVSVSDTGLGIPPDALPKLFDKFYRVENFKRFAKGTGLGLNLCKNIVESVHRGQIGVDSTLGMGSRFWFSIPMRYSGSQAA